VNQPTGIDLALLRRAQQGDADAFCDLVRDQEERLFQQAFSLCRDAALAEDLAQDTLLVAWRRLDQFTERCRFFTWLCGILINLARNAARRSRNIPQPVSSLAQGSREQADHLLEILAESEATPAEHLQMEERARTVQQCLDRLSEKQREVVYLRFFVDDSLESIASALNCSLGTVKSRLFYALENLNGMSELTQFSPPLPPT
jgi:RNA polymerase sigma-70 factor (ECF subfamily)